MRANDLSSVKTTSSLDPLDNDIKDLVEKIKNAASKEEAIFIIQRYGSGWDKSFITANEDGLLLFAAEIMEAYLEKDGIQKRNKNMIGVKGPNELFNNGDTKIHYIEYTDEKRKTFDANAPRIARWTEEENFGCIVAAIIIVIIILVGLKTIFSWF